MCQHKKTFRSYLSPSTTPQQYILKYFLNSTMSNDRAKDRAKDRARRGLSRELEVSRLEKGDKPHASEGGTRGYSVNFRELVLQEALVKGVPSAALSFNVSKNSIRNWMKRIHPYRMTGNKQKECITGFDQFLLCLSIYIYPRASSDQHAAFIVRNGGSRVYSRSDISRRCKELDLKRKKCSLEAYKAFTPRNQLLFDMFFS